MIGPEPALVRVAKAAPADPDARPVARDERRGEGTDFAALLGLADAAPADAAPAEAPPPFDPAVLAAPGAAPVPSLPSAPLPVVEPPAAAMATASAPVAAGPGAAMPLPGVAPAVAAAPAPPAAESEPSLLAAPTPARPAEAPVAVAAPTAAPLAAAPAAPGAPAAEPDAARPEPSGPEAAPPPPTEPAGRPVAAAPAEAPAPALLRGEAGPPGWTLVRDPAPAAPVRHEVATPAAAPQPVIAQIAVAVAGAEQGTVEIRLDPPELGRVQIQLTPTDGGVQATVLADRPETGDLLRRHAAQLARELGEAGYAEVSLDFATGGEAARDQAQAPLPRETWSAPLVAAEPTAAAPAPVARHGAGGLDIRI